MSLKDNINLFQRELQEFRCRLIAVSKTKPAEMVQEAFEAGQRIFGENKAQEMMTKYDQLPKEIEWHMIGHVQSNKVKYMIPYVKLIHGVDSLKLLKEINRLAAKWRKKVDCLLQIHIAEEETKFGLDEKELEEILNYVQDDKNEMNNIRIVGLMGMATFTDNHEQIKKEFQNLKSIFDNVSKLKTDNCQLNTLSMGMSGDYQLAIECGSTMVRIGSSIFGTR